MRRVVASAAKASREKRKRLQSEDSSTSKSSASSDAAGNGIDGEPTATADAVEELSGGGHSLNFRDETLSTDSTQTSPPPEASSTVKREWTSPARSGHHVSSHGNGDALGDPSEEDDDDVSFDDLVMQDECFEESFQEVEAPAKRHDSEPPQNLVKSDDTARSLSVAPYRYCRPPPVICGESVEVEALMHRAQFFLARSCKENIAIAKERSLWTTSQRVEQIVGDAFTKAPVVIFVFFDREADFFDGFAVVTSKALYRGQPALRWKEFRGGGNIQLKWVSRCTLPIDVTRRIKNPFNKDREVFAGADGSEIQRSAGQRLCSLFPFEEGTDVRALLRRVKARRRAQRKRKAGFRRLSRTSGDSLPSLLDTRISFTQYKKARRNVTLEKRYESWDDVEQLDYLYAPPRAVAEYGRRGLIFEDLLQFARPMSLMDVPVRSPPRIYEPSSSSSLVQGWRTRARSPAVRTRAHSPHSSRYRRRSRSVERTRRGSERSPRRKESSRRREHEGRTSYLDSKRKRSPERRSSKHRSSHRR